MRSAVSTDGARISFPVGELESQNWSAGVVPSGASKMTCMTPDEIAFAKSRSTDKLFSNGCSVGGAVASGGNIPMMPIGHQVGAGAPAHAPSSVEPVQAALSGLAMIEVGVAVSKNVKQLGLSLDNGFSYASGVALLGGTGTFTMSSFSVTP